MVEVGKYKISVIKKIIEKTQGKRWFTVADYKEGYYQVLLKKEHKHKTSFYFENVLYQHKISGRIE